MNLRKKRNLFLQKIFWNRTGFCILSAYVKLRRRIDYVLLNHSLDSDTNGEFWLLQNLPPQPTVLDVGFNTGDFTSHILHAAPQAKVWAFDPAQQAAKAFQENFASESRVIFVPAALSDQEGEMEFHDYDNMCSSLAKRPDAGPEARTYKVRVTTLTTWFKESGLERIDFLKIDAEGYDANVIAGAIPLLKEKRVGCIMFEFANGWVNNRRFLGEVAAMLEPTGYTLNQLFNGFLAPVRYSSRNERFDMGRMFVITPSFGWANQLPKNPFASID